MRAYALSLLAQTVLVVFLSLTAVFMMVRLSGDPVLLFMPMDIQAKDVNEFRQRLGFNDPVPVQYARFVAGAVRGDFGESDRKSTRLNSSHLVISYAVFCLKKKKKIYTVHSLQVCNSHTTMTCST